MKTVELLYFQSAPKQVRNIYSNLSAIPALFGPFLLYLGLLGTSRMNTCNYTDYTTRVSQEFTNSPQEYVGHYVLGATKSL